MTTVEMDFKNQKLEIETGRMAKQANGSVVVKHGETMILVTAVAKKQANDDNDFFPLTVDYREKSYAAGKIPGGYIKREGPPRAKEILSSRLIDRPIRPLFPDGYKNDVQIIAYVLSYDQENDGDVLAICGASAALSISNIPFHGPVAGVRVGLINGEFVVNPTRTELEESEMDIVVAGSRESIVMVEGESSEVSQEIVLDALKFAHEHIKKLIEIQDDLISEVGKSKTEFVKKEIDPDLVSRVTEEYKTTLEEANVIQDKEERADKIDALVEEAVSKFAEEYPESEKDVKSILHDIEKNHLRTLILDEKVRVDGRKLDEIRPITVEVGVLPRAHGSALFTRGQTQSLGVVTLGTKMDEQRIDNLQGESFKSYMLHYNFPPFSVGEVRPVRSPGRREIGHGNLAERAIQPVLPTEESFPYTIRLVSDILESNGSSSMATVCSGSLALMDAGIPIKAPVSGVAMGLIKGEDKFAVLTDILGAEDHLGDMDFKVCGTEQGITAFQMDIKIEGITFDIIETALKQAHQARLFILNKMNEIIDNPRTELSDYAPRVLVAKISAENIGEVIGPGGKMIRQIQEETETTVTIDQDGTVHIMGLDKEKSQKAKEIIEGIGNPPQPGDVKTGKVIRVLPFGAVIAFDYSKEGLLHISEIDHKRIESVEKVFKENDEVTVKIVDIDRNGKIKLSRKALIPRK